MAGTDPSVGITLTSADDEVTRITDDMIAVNDPSRLIFLIPAGLADGEYTLTVTTQWNNSQSLLKTPRSVTQKLYIGVTPEQPGDGSGDGEDEDDNQSGSPL